LDSNNDGYIPKQNLDFDIDADGIQNYDPDGDGYIADFDADIDGDGILNWNDLDMDGDFIDNINDPDIDSDGVPNWKDIDVDSDGYKNFEDIDIDGDGKLNINDADIDGDFILNDDDPDVDADGIIDQTYMIHINKFINSLDLDPNGDIDGDGLINNNDNDIDGDEILNGDDANYNNDGFQDQFLVVNQYNGFQQNYKIDISNFIIKHVEGECKDEIYNFLALPEDPNINRREISKISPGKKYLIAVNNSCYFKFKCYNTFPEYTMCVKEDCEALNNIHTDNFYFEWRKDDGDAMAYCHRIICSEELFNNPVLHKYISLACETKDLCRTLGGYWCGNKDNYASNQCYLNFDAYDCTGKEYCVTARGCKLEEQCLYKEVSRFSGGGPQITHTMWCGACYEDSEDNCYYCSFTYCDNSRSLYSLDKCSWIQISHSCSYEVCESTCCSESGCSPCSKCCNPRCHPEYGCRGSLKDPDSCDCRCRSTD
jgi:hypothetical protein